MSVPLVFWFLAYSFPLLVFTAIILRIFLGIENGNKNKEDESGNTTSAENKRYLKHARSVRRRRAKLINVDDSNNNSQCNLEEKNAVFSTSFNHDMVDKNPLIEESPREIREIEVDSSFTNGTTGEGPTRFTYLEKLKDEEQEESRKWNGGDQKSVMDVGIERTKRLESMIARRRARKLLSLQVRRTLMNMDRYDSTTANLPSLVIPKHDDTSVFSSNDRDQVSPVPGSAPSVMIPMRNPFDLPYDPHEEKPDLTGDSFQQEFMSTSQNDVMFCRHESFSLGAYLPVENKQNRLEGTSSFQDFGFRQKRSSEEYQVSNNMGNPFCKQKSYTCNETKNTRETESGTSPVIEPESISNSADDQIKEIIQVHENGYNSQLEDTDRTHEGSVPDGNSSTTPSSSSSSQENEPYYKIDKGAILKSLSSMARRNNDIEAKESTDQIGDHLKYGAYISDKNSLDDQFYYTDKIVPHHTPSFSIASDMQVEVSEISSPPLTINENISSQDEDVSTYDVDMDKEIARCGLDSWEGLSHLSGVESESLSKEVNEISEQDISEVEISRIQEYEDSPVVESMNRYEMMNMPSPPENREDLEEVQGGHGFVGISFLQAVNLTENLVVQQILETQNASLSPNSVLQPAFSSDRNILSSADQEAEEIQPSVSHLSSPVNSRNSASMMEHSLVLPQAGVEIEISEEPSEDSRVSTASLDNQETLESNGLNSTGAASAVSSKISCGDEPAESSSPEETGFRSLNKNAEASTKSIEADGPNPLPSAGEVFVQGYWQSLS
ncbi:dentin sialophosphoprotein-like [Dorcoceras hygrometricum]|uniref:Dentin sialophosphoprotein-like n=1 Tax=Dorcoceras hygrometricum TaxID=472368 RepID=A0A2Z7AXS3_9LAMI|nr:dentin sialophosphoprotein-like [Dorcoceras hygrometricum]